MSCVADEAPFLRFGVKGGWQYRLGLVALGLGSLLGLFVAGVVAKGVKASLAGPTESWSWVVAYLLAALVLLGVGAVLVRRTEAVEFDFQERVVRIGSEDLPLDRCVAVLFAQGGLGWVERTLNLFWSAGESPRYGLSRGPSAWSMILLEKGGLGEGLLQRLRSARSVGPTEVEEIQRVAAEARIRYASGERPEVWRIARHTALQAGLPLIEAVGGEVRVWDPDQSEAVSKPAEPGPGLGSTPGELAVTEARGRLALEWPSSARPERADAVAIAVIGLLCLCAALLLASGASRIILLVIGALCLLTLGVWPWISRRYRTDRLEVDGRRIRYLAANGRSWDIRWDELEGIQPDPRSLPPAVVFLARGSEFPCYIDPENGLQLRERLMRFRAPAQEGREEPPPARRRARSTGRVAPKGKPKQ